MSKKKIILITGGAGFIGSHLSEALIKYGGYYIRILDNLSTGKYSNLIFIDNNLEFIQGDILDKSLLNYAVKDCYAVVHLAATVSVQESIDSPILTHKNNFITTLQLCDTMCKLGIKRLIFASSAAVYGENSINKAINENTITCPLTPYAIDKLTSEYYLKFFFRKFGLEPLIFRLFNVYGPRNNYSGVISILMEQAINELPITIFGDGTQTRDFIYVTDVVQCFIQALESYNFKNNIINIGLNKPISINNLLEEIKNLLGKLPIIINTIPRIGDIKNSYADNKKLLKFFKIHHTPIKSGVKFLFKYKIKEKIKEEKKGRK